MPNFAIAKTLYHELSSRRFALDARLEHTGPTTRRTAADGGNFGIAAAVGYGQYGHRQPHHEPHRADVRGASRANQHAVPGRNTALVSYWLGSGSAYAWVVAPGELSWTRLGSPRAIANQALAFHHSLARLVDVPVERRLQDACGPIFDDPAAARAMAVTRAQLGDHSRRRARLRSLSRPGMGDAPRRLFVALEHDVAVTPAAWMLDTQSRLRHPRTTRKGSCSWPTRCIRQMTLGFGPCRCQSARPTPAALGRIPSSRLPAFAVYRAGSRRRLPRNSRPRSP